MVALGLHMAKFDFFQQVKGIEANENVKKFVTDSEQIPVDIENEDVINVMKEFCEFEQEVIEGKHGKTQQFYAIFIKLINYYLLFERSVRSNDFDLYLYNYLN